MDYFGCRHVLLINVIYVYFKNSSHTSFLLIITNWLLFLKYPCLNINTVSWIAFDRCWF